MASTVDLTNLKDKIPELQTDAESYLHALIDMGSNGIRFSISDLNPARARLLRCVYRERAAISLFDALEDGPDSTLVFSMQTMKLVARAIARFRRIATQFGVPITHMTLFATEAARKASNSALLFDAIQEVAPGVAMHILTPQVETLLGALGARSGFHKVKGVFLDLGGGSVQMCYVDTSKTDYHVQAALTGQSLPLGAAKLNKVLNATADSQSRAEQVNKVQGDISRAFMELCALNPDLAADARPETEGGVDVYLCGGGFRGYGSMLMHSEPIGPYPIPQVGTYSVTPAYFKDVKRMRHTNENYPHKIHGMSARRRKQFPAVATVVEGLCEAIVSMQSVTFCAGGNREGALMMMLPRGPRESDPLTWLHTPVEQGVGVGKLVVRAVTDIITGAMPANIVHREMYNLTLAPLLAQRMWERSGYSSNSNASAALHEAADRDPDVPGMTHCARACLAIALWARWGGDTPPADWGLYVGLRAILDAMDPDVCFWAEYMGAIAACITTVFPTWPQTASEVETSIGFDCVQFEDRKKDRLVRLRTKLSEEAMQSLGTNNLNDHFKIVGKGRKEGLKVKPFIDPKTSVSGPLPPPTRPKIGNGEEHGGSRGDDNNNDEDGGDSEIK